jgi:hypothetical protein
MQKLSSAANKLSSALGTQDGMQKLSSAANKLSSALGNIGASVFGA